MTLGFEIHISIPGKDNRQYCPNTLSIPTNLTVEDFETVEGFQMVI